jgi:threonine/homoserine/homoserine lactone efflux protein
MGITNYTTFIIASFIFIISPGIDTIFILNKSVSQGHKAGVYAVLGITTGVLVHTTLAAFGLSLIVARSAVAFSIIKYMGAAYLVYLGVTKLLSNESIVKQNSHTQLISLKKTYLSAVLTDVLNPKVAIFFLAFFPQFVQQAHIHNAMPFIILGASYAVMGLLWLLILTYFAGTFSTRLKTNPAIGNWLNKFSAVAFVLMGIKVALTKK